MAATLEKGEVLRILDRCRLGEPLDRLRQQARVILEGQVMITVNYTRSYSPGVHWIELGIAERAESIVGVTYSNFRVGR